MELQTRQISTGRTKFQFYFKNTILFDNTTSNVTRLGMKANEILKYRPCDNDFLRTG